MYYFSNGSLILNSCDAYFSEVMYKTLTTQPDFAQVFEILEFPLSLYAFILHVNHLFESLNRLLKLNLNRSSNLKDQSEQTLEVTQLYIM